MKWSLYQIITYVLDIVYVAYTCQIVNFDVVTSIIDCDILNNIQITMDY